MKALTLVLELLSRLLDFITQKRINRESQKAKDDPTGWFNEHFNADDRVQLDSDKDSATNETTDTSDSK